MPLFNYLHSLNDDRSRISLRQVSEDVQTDRQIQEDEYDPFADRPSAPLISYVVLHYFSLNISSSVFSRLIAISNSQNLSIVSSWNLIIGMQLNRIFYKVVHSDFNVVLSFFNIYTFDIQYVVSTSTILPNC